MRMQIHANSLSKTVDSINESAFFASKSDARTRHDVARWIAARQGLPGCYGEMFAGFDCEQDGIQLFTGEKITSASARHILGEEACRAMRLLNVRDKTVRAALERANAGMMKCLNASERGGSSPGWFCCGKCTVGMWRNLLCGGLDRTAERLSCGISVLRQHRDGAKGWKRFPFWYTVLALIEIEDKAATAELKRVGAKLKRAARSLASAEPFKRRRQAIAERGMSRI